MADDEVFDDELDGEDEEDVVVLTDDNNEEVEFEHLDTVEHDGRTYEVLLPVDADEDEAAEVLILEVRPSADNPDEEDEYVTLDSEELLDEIFNIFCDRHADEFEFEK